MDSISKTDIDKIFGKILKTYRLKKGYTQEVMAEKLGISLKYISRIENGYSGIKTRTLINYMNILGITPNTIYKEFMTNKEIIKQINISEKLNQLSEEILNFVDDMIDLLINIK